MPEGHEVRYPDPPELSCEEWADRLRRQRHAIDMMELSFSRNMAQFAATSAYEFDGSVSAIDWLRFNCPLLLSGILDSVGGAALRTALEPLARKSGAHDDRSFERRLADALVDLSMHGLDSGLIPQRGSQRTHLQVTATLETLRGLPGAGAADMEFSLPISAKTVERLACDCSITRIVLGSDSMVIDVGRAKRVISGPARKALNARDRGCVWPGCERPASWTSGHHLVHWIHGGTNKPKNLALLCHRHHWMVHEGNWQILRGDDGRVVVIPPTVTFGPLARSPD